MKPVMFAEANAVYAQDQPQYQPLPACCNLTPEGKVVSCWKLSWCERLKLLVTGRLWLCQLTFHAPLQPQLPTTKYPFARGCGDNQKRQP